MTLAKKSETVVKTLKTVPWVVTATDDCDSYQIILLVVQYTIYYHYVMFQIIC